MENNPYTPLDVLEYNQFDINYLQSSAFQQTPSQPENFWVTDGLLYTEDFPSWGNQSGGYSGMSLQRDFQPCEPYSSSSSMTSDDFANQLMSITNPESLASASPGLGFSPAMLDQLPSLSNATLSETSPGSEQSTLFPLEESPRQSQNVPSPVMDWTCGHCARSFTKKYLRTKHEQIHTKPILCPVAPRCQHRTAMKRDMRRHIAVHHAGDNTVRSPVSVQNFACGVSGCKYEAKRKDHLTRHVRKVHSRMIL